MAGCARERPRHETYVDAFYIGKFEVTNSQFESFSPGHRSAWKQFSSEDDTPAVAVSWEGASAFCRWLSRREGIGYRLPTEAEWERAARGTDGRVFPWGNSPPLAEDASYRCNLAPSRDRGLWKKDGFEFTAPVGSFAGGVSPCGCHDMSGNVWEWCMDWYDASAYSKGALAGPGPARLNPSGPPLGKQRVLRGGSFAEDAWRARCANRTAHAPGFVEASVGFRCVRALDPIFLVEEDHKEEGRGAGGRKGDAAAP